MAVDANVLVFERSKEEFSAGRRLRSAVLEGFKKAWSAIADSNATTVLAAIILFYFAAGAVRGFGITLSIGVLVWLFTALVVTRVLVEAALTSAFLSSQPDALGMTVEERLRSHLVERPTDLMSCSGWWFALSLAVLVVALIGFVRNGLNLGLEFTGGRLIEYSTARSVDLDDLRTELAASGFPRAVAQESGDGNVSIRAGRLSEADEARIQAGVEALGGDVDKVRDEFIGPTIGDELRRKSTIALGLGLGAQLSTSPCGFAGSTAGPRSSPCSTTS